MKIKQFYQISFLFFVLTILWVLYCHKFETTMLIFSSIFCVLIMISFFFFKNGRKKQKSKRYFMQNELVQIDGMTGVQFEEYLKNVFEQKGYHAALTPTTNDYGADLILKKDNKKYVVQAKRYQDLVGIKAVQEVLGAKFYYQADQAIVYTNSFFTSSAKNLAKAAGIILYDRNTLSKQIKQLQSEI